MKERLIKMSKREQIVDIEMIRKGISDTFTNSMVEKGKFRFIGQDIEEYEDMVTVSMQIYAQGLNEIIEIRKVDTYEKLKKMK